MKLPISGEMLCSKALQDTKQKPVSTKLPLREVALGAIARTKSVQINDLSLVGKILNA
jgi:hypothetical protein